MIHGIVLIAANQVDQQHTFAIRVEIRLLDDNAKLVGFRLRVRIDHLSLPVIVISSHPNLRE
jgi:hypothetical protein